MAVIHVSRGQYDAYEVILKNGTGYQLDDDLDFNSFDGVNIGEFVFVSSGIPISTIVAMSSFVGSFHLNVPDNESIFFRVDGIVEVEIDQDGLDIRNGWLELENRNEPPNPTSNHLRLFAQTISSKVNLRVIFPTGFAQTIAVEA